jgi:hypothetical protein
MRRIVRHSNCGLWLSTESAPNAPPAQRGVKETSGTLGARHALYAEANYVQHIDCRRTR